jgi:hypothetical protein
VENRGARDLEVALAPVSFRVAVGWGWGGAKVWSALVTAGPSFAVRRLMLENRGKPESIDRADSKRRARHFLILRLLSLSHLPHTKGFNALRYYAAWARGGGSESFTFFPFLLFDSFTERRFDCVVKRDFT